VLDWAKNGGIDPRVPGQLDGVIPVTLSPAARNGRNIPRVRDNDFVAEFSEQCAEPK
jgi:hypothetical protein